MTEQGRFAVVRPSEVPLDSLVDLVRSYEEHITEAATCTRDDVLLETCRPGFEDNSWCLTGPGGTAFGWAVLTPLGDTLDAALIVRPGRHAESAARTLLARLLDRADELPARHGIRYTLTVREVPSADEVVASVLQEAGFSPGATAQRYTIDLTLPPPAPVLPDGGGIRRAGEDDFTALHAVHLASRSTDPKTEDADLFGIRARRLLETGGAVLLLAEVEGRPTGYVLTQAVCGKEGRIAELAVAPAFRGLGIGHALLTAGLSELRALGVARARVVLDTGDLHDPEALGLDFTLRAVRTVTRFHRGGD
ncbi:GNAT family N-acetyltransferase [Streptomyces seoulensis]